ncbi:MAG: bifunctional riboflavin kinase/FAD synthetase [Vicinamibacteria bacterium]
MDLRIESLLGRAHDARHRAVAIGNFDGVHLGHARLLKACVETARRDNLVPTVLTFDPHPASVVSDQGAPARIQTLTSRRRALRDLGIEDLGQLSFDQGIARLSPAEFVEKALIGGCHASSVVVGEGFRFGAARIGNVQTLRTLGESRFETVEVEALKDASGAISSSRIREALGRGDLPEAERCLGRPYEIEGKVVHGDHRGRTIGYPTANIDLEGVSALSRGIYVADGFVVHNDDDGDTSGEAPMRAAVSLGVRPTFKDAADLRLEAHFPGFAGDLYGRTLRLVFLARLREEASFDSVDALTNQIEDDVQRAVAFRDSNA